MTLNTAPPSFLNGVYTHSTKCAWKCSSLFFFKHFFSQFKQEIVDFIIIILFFPVKKKKNGRYHVRCESANVKRLYIYTLKNEIIKKRTEEREPPGAVVMVEEAARLPCRIENRVFLLCRSLFFFILFLLWYRERESDRVKRGGSEKKFIYIYNLLLQLVFFFFYFDGGVCYTFPMILSFCCIQFAFWL